MHARALVLSIKFTSDASRRLVSSRHYISVITVYIVFTGVRPLSVRLSVISKTVSCNNVRGAVVVVLFGRRIIPGTNFIGRNVTQTGFIPAFLQG